MPDSVTHTQTRTDINGLSIAFEFITGQKPGVIWLGGYQSDMLGTKACALAQWAKQKEHAFLRHDYSGHGQSEGNSLDGTISCWLDESLIMLERFQCSPCILVGSSMGAWIALRMVQELQKVGKQNLVQGLLLIAPAPDFTKDLIESSLDEAKRHILLEKGSVEIPSSGSSESLYISKTLIEDGYQHLVLEEGSLDIHCPVHIIHGIRDTDVPSSHALKLAHCLPTNDLTLSFIPDGDHRLSRLQDIEKILFSLESMIDQIRS